MYSTIKRKTCKCSESCKLMPTISYAGYNINHAPVEIKEKLQSKNKEAQKRKNNNEQKTV